MHLADQDPGMAPQGKGMQASNLPVNLLYRHTLHEGRTTASQQDQSGRRVVTVDGISGYMCLRMARGAVPGFGKLQL